MKTDAGLDLFDKVTILERLAKWSKDMCQIHKIDPGSELMHALEQQLSWHEDNMNAHQYTVQIVNDGNEKVLRAVEQLGKSMAVESDNKLGNMDIGDEQNVTAAVETNDTNEKMDDEQNVTAAVETNDANEQAVLVETENNGEWRRRKRSRSSMGENKGAACR